METVRLWIAASGISPKLVYATVVALLAAIALWIITGDSSFLVALLIPLVGLAAGTQAPAALSSLRQPNVTQRDAQRLADKPLSARR